MGPCFGTLVRLCAPVGASVLETLALRQQVGVPKRRLPRPRLNLVDKLFWVAIRRFWSGWQPCLTCRNTARALPPGGESWGSRVKGKPGRDSRRDRESRYFRCAGILAKHRRAEVGPRMRGARGQTRYDAGLVSEAHREP